MTTEYLKSRYSKSIQRGFLPFNLIVFWGLVLSNLDVAGFDALVASISLEETVVALIVSVATVVLDGLVSADNKARVVFWRLHDPLPGSRAFSEHLPREPRANQEHLIFDWGELPINAPEQNHLWYRMLKKHETDIRVSEAHYRWLITRDLTSFAFLFLIFLGGATISVEFSRATSSIYLLLLGLQYLACMVAARNYGVRFVRTVLAVASSSRIQTKSVH